MGEPRRRQPRLHIRELTDDYCEFVLSDTDPSVANALRRVMLVEVCAMLLTLCSIFTGVSLFHCAPLRGQRNHRPWPVIRQNTLAKWQAAMPSKVAVSWQTLSGLTVLSVGEGAHHCHRLVGIEQNMAAVRHGKLPCRPKLLLAGRLHLG
jgi:hypothetical protein